MTRAEAAVRYAEKYSWNILPIWPIREDGLCSCPLHEACESPGKHPVTHLVPNGKYNATNDTSRIRKWWARGDWNIGLNCAMSGVFVLDVDPRSGGTEGEFSLLPLPETPMSLTGGGGTHRLFTAPNGEPSDSPGAMPPGCEIKWNGLIVLPPSNHVSGKTYEWEASSGPAQVPMADVPQKILDLLRARTNGNKPGERVAKGGRHKALTTKAAQLRNTGVSTAVIKAALHAWNLECFDPPMAGPELREVDKIAEWAGEAHADERFNSPPDLAEKTVAPTSSSTSCFTIKSTQASVLKHMAIERPPSLVGDGLISAGQLALLYGKPGKGKSWLTFQVAIALANGGAFLGLSTSPCKTALFTLECPPWQVQQRLKALSGEDDSGLENISVVCREDLSSALDLALPEHQDAIIAHVRGFGASLLIIDALSRAHQSDENDAKAMGAILAAADRIRIETGAAVLIVHHERKPGTGRQDKDADDLDALRGSTRLQSDPQTALRLVESHDMFCLRVAKCNWGKGCDPIWMRQASGGWFVVTKAPEESKKLAESNRDKLANWASVQIGGFCRSDAVDLGLLNPKGGVVDPKTIQRYLAQLVKDGLLSPLGEGAKTRYYWIGDSDGEQVSCPHVSDVKSKEDQELGLE